MVGGRANCWKASDQLPVGAVCNRTYITLLSLTMVNHQPIVVIGAGIGGLTTAAVLAKAGLPVTLLEAHVYPGGCAGTFYHKKYHFDAGATLAGAFTLAARWILSRRPPRLPTGRFPRRGALKMPRWSFICPMAAQSRVGRMRSSARMNISGPLAPRPLPFGAGKNAPPTRSGIWRCGRRRGPHKPPPRACA